MHGVGMDAGNRWVAVLLHSPHTHIGVHVSRAIEGEQSSTASPALASHASIAPRYASACASCAIAAIAEALVDHFRSRQPCTVSALRLKRIDFDKPTPPFVVVLLHRCIVALLHCRIVVLLYCCIVVLLYWCAVVLVLLFCCVGVLVLVCCCCCCRCRSLLISYSICCFGVGVGDL
jgi:hypothetical protein